MKAYERTPRMREGWILSALLLLCAAIMLACHLHAKPKAETLYPIHALPNGYEDLTKLDLNSASAQELERLDGVGEVLARRIVAYRETCGGFRSIEEIMQVSGVGEGVFAGIKDHIIVNEPCE